MATALAAIALILQIKCVSIQWHKMMGKMFNACLFFFFLFIFVEVCAFITYDWGWEGEYMKTQNHPETSLKPTKKSHLNFLPFIFFFLYK